MKAFFTVLGLASFMGLAYGDDEAAREHLRNLYEEHCQTFSDIYEHLPTLKAVAQECSSVTEIGLRTMESTWAVLQGLSENSSANRCYTGIDIECPPIDTLLLAKNLAEELAISFTFIQGNDMYIDIEPTELLFIDSNHTYRHLTYELEKFSPKALKYIAMHDTDEPWGYRDEPQCDMDQPPYPKKISIHKRGLWLAVQDFLRKHPEWSLHERRRNNNGFTILKRVGA